VEVVAHVGLGVAGVADVDRVPHIVSELEEVRTALRVLERDEVRDQGHRVRLVGRDERVEVGVVGDRVHGDLGRFAVRRHG
jgi:tetrahydromethanopterin S-methyltransferase subunit F